MRKNIYNKMLLLLMVSSVSFGCSKNILETERNDKTILPACFNDSIPPIFSPPDSFKIVPDMGTRHMTDSLKTE